ncbi:cell wall integrity and stress response component 3 [Oreochromis niloticus]|uniref:cell wall integrity and stress response component 3 n=1 Tax=Oreochromis niloticus TaxID=8128 RepID=UPI000674F1BC|nr:cell wall integrity and stress response component 3 [Oreochromis niloticus]
MAAFTWIQMSSLLILMLQFNGTAEQYSPVYAVRAEHDVTLPCKNLIHNKCKSTTWLFSDSGSTRTLFENGQIHKDTQTKSDRLTVKNKNCSLVIKKVSVEDVGRYTCRKFNKSGQQQGPDIQADLTVISITKHENHGDVMLNCSVFAYGHCGHKVEWLYEDEKKISDMKISAGRCTSTVTFTRSDLSKFSKLLKCNVTDTSTKNVTIFPFKPQKSSDKDANKTKSTMASTSTTTANLMPTLKTSLSSTISSTSSTAASSTIISSTLSSILSSVLSTTGSSTSMEVKTSAVTPVYQKASGNQLWFIIVPVGLAGLLITAVVVTRWKKNAENQKLLSDSTDEAENDVSYVTISFTKKAQNKAQARCGDDEGDTVTYSTVKASSSSAGGFTDSSNLYSTINKLKKENK